VSAFRTVITQVTSSPHVGPGWGGQSAFVAHG